MTGSHETKMIINNPLPQEGNMAGDPKLVEQMVQSNACFHAPGPQKSSDPVAIDKMLISAIGVEDLRALSRISTISEQSDFHQVSLALNGSRGQDQKRIAEEGIKNLAIMLRKNSDYGSAVWETPVLCPNLPAKEAIFVRMSDKIKRITSLRTKAKIEVTDESLVDTIRDLGNYCSLWIMAPEKEQV